MLLPISPILLYALIIYGCLFPVILIIVFVGYSVVVTVRKLIS